MDIVIPLSNIHYLISFLIFMNSILSSCYENSAFSSCIPCLCSFFLTNQLFCYFNCLFRRSLWHQVSFPVNIIHSILFTPSSLIPPPNLPLFLHYSIISAVLSLTPNVFNCLVKCNVLTICQFLHIFLRTHNSFPKFHTSYIFRHVFSPK
jgi:hypothetical protein